MVGWEPVLFQVLWVFKILTHLQLHYDQTVSHVWSNRGQTVECLNFCVECPYFSVECLNFCVVPLPPKIYQFCTILVYFCTCSICIHANKGIPAIATAGHVATAYPYALKPCVLVGFIFAEWVIKLGVCACCAFIRFIVVQWSYQPERCQGILAYHPVYPASAWFESISLKTVVVWHTSMWWCAALLSSI